MRSSLVVAAALCLSGPALADPTVVELFTSQSCYSCPPAEEYLGELARRPDVIALEWHVDYWNELVYGRAGRWHDVFSDPAYTERQRLYNQRIRGWSGVYTPQMIIDGRTEAVGSRRRQVEAAIVAAGAQAGSPVTLAVQRTAERMLRITVDGAPETGTSLWLVHLIPGQVTSVDGGENSGLTLTNHNVVVATEQLGPWSGGATEFTARMEEETCAILVQADGQGPILAAHYCPS